LAFIVAPRCVLAVDRNTARGVPNERRNRGNFRAALSLSLR
jgi:hypothetical protein